MEPLKDQCAWSEFELASLKSLDIAALPALAVRLREALKRSLKRTGGHYGSPLGVVELAVSLHASFDSPRDALIWDTGHQCYAHKVITGRGNELSSLRRWGGLSGFPNPAESHHDQILVGHASTSIASAYGLSLARRKDVWTVAIIGDAALAGGPALEALMVIGSIPRNIVVVVNDNGRSIDKNVSSIQGESAIRALALAAGVSYVGPVDGHDAVALCAAFNGVRQRACKALVHVKTIKGFDNIDLQHAATSLHMWAVKRDEFVPQKYASIQALVCEYLCAHARKTNSLRFISAAMAKSAGFGAFADQHPEQFIDVGIAEATAVTAAVGMASGGLTPVVHIYSTFLQRAYDQILHDLSLQQANVKLIVDRCGLSGEDGPTHHGIHDLSILREIKSVSIWSISTATPVDVIATVVERFLRSNAPSALKVCKSVGYTPFSSDGRHNELEFIVHREGADLAFVTYGRLTSEVIRAAELVLEAEPHLRICVVELLRLNPITWNSLSESIAANTPVLIVEEHVYHGSVSEDMRISGWLDARTSKSMVIFDPEIPHGPVSKQMDAVGFSARCIADVAQRLLGNLCGNREDNHLQIYLN
ncbi:1-deoxy-D-xylulose-5-phosphate synthase N-terminal domain-containing protein [Paraburkholderia tropica]|uniref:1-deoxy-D-xylulose-5-phosphate synthase N-terminal domain-containing protein n=1 Tax=Paraburkholderia tropica TaxID=92647 RepID=UPI002AB7BA00|nr:1-deoxy-D-xylulose-5-phosphate synthase N-terminal domain-containing protein [Paraburkholderia tropica]